MDRDRFKKKFTNQLSLSIFMVLILSCAWEFSLRAQLISWWTGDPAQIASGSWGNVIANTFIVMVSMVFPAVTILKGTLSSMSEVEKRLGSSDRRYRTIVESTNDIIIQLDTDGTIVYANPATRLLGFDERELVGRMIGDVIFNENKEDIVPAITTKRVGHRATFNCAVQLITSNNSVLAKETPAIEFLVDACGMWEQPDNVVQTLGAEKKCIGTLCVARPVVDRALLEELELED